MEKKYFIIAIGEDLKDTFLFTILDTLNQQGNYYTVTLTSYEKQFDVKRVSKEEFNKYNLNESK